MASNDRGRRRRGSRPWSGRFSEPATDLVKRFTASVAFDRRLAEFDIEASLAHARMLRAAGVLRLRDLAAIRRGMARILAEVRGGTFPWSIEHEDVHLNIEHRLTDLVGDAGRRLHTARSRNDQVATDVRLYLRAAIDRSLDLIKRLQETLLGLAETHADTVIRVHAPPGCTTGVVRPPPDGYFEMLARDSERLADSAPRQPAAARRPRLPHVISIDA